MLRGNSVALQLGFFRLRIPEKLEGSFYFGIRSFFQFFFPFPVNTEDLFNARPGKIKILLQRSVLLLVDLLFLYSELFLQSFPVRNNIFLKEVPFENCLAVDLFMHPPV